MTVDQYQKWYFKKHGLYERKALGMLNKFVRNSLSNVELSELNYEQQLNLYLPADQLKEVLKDIYFEIGVLHGTRIETGLNSGILDIKNGDPYNTKPLFSERWFNLLRSFFDNFNNKIVTIRQNLIKGVTDIITQQLSKGKSIEVITRELVAGFGQKTGLYSWQMRRIARTETNAAASKAAFEAYKDTNFVVDKVWVSAKDERTRETHFDLHGVTIPLTEAFETIDKEGQPERLMYPGDENGSAENVINCRCTIAPKVRLDSDGLPILKTDLNN